MQLQTWLISYTKPQQNKHKFVTITVVVMAMFSKKKSDIPRRRTQASKPIERATDTALEERYAFRRNRTITGSVASGVVSANESNAQLKSPRVQAHELSKKRRSIGATLLMVLVGCALLFTLIHQFTAVPIVKTTDSSIKLDTSYSEIIQSYFSTRPIERLRFLTNTNLLNDFVQTRAPEVADVHIMGSAGLGESMFVLTMREPIAGWSINGRQRYVDSTGTAFANNYFTPPTVQIIDNSGIQVQAGQAVASNRFLGFVGRAVGLAKIQGYIVRQVIIPSGTTRQVELRLDGVGYSVKLSVDRSAGEQMEDMARVIKYLKERNINPEYIDVRVAGKAFYR